MGRPRPAASPSLRVARAVAVAAVAVGTSLGGHVLAGGPVPSTVPSVAPLAVTVLVVTAFTGVLSALRWTPIRLVAALAVAQAAVHLACGHGAAAGSGSMGTGGDDLRMIGWHLVATAVGTALVLRAEGWLWRVFAGLAPECFRLVSVPIGLLRRPVARAGQAPPAHGFDLGRTPARRGPPAPAGL